MIIYHNAIILRGCDARSVVFRLANVQYRKSVFRRMQLVLSLNLFISKLTIILKLTTLNRFC